MAVRKLPPDYENKTRQKLKDEDCPKSLLVIFNFAFTPMIQDLMKELDSKFDGIRGNKAYPRVLLLIVVLYCFSKNINKYDSMSEECKHNDCLKIILDNKKPSRGTFTNFMNNSDTEVTHKIFISTLVLLNDLKAFSIIKVFIDGTDIIVRASRNYWLKQKDLDVMYQLFEWNLLHDGSKQGIEKSLEGLNIKLKEYEDDEDMVKLIESAKRRIKIHKHKVFAKRKRYEKIFEKRGDVKLSIIFPEAVYMKTKRGRFDFAFNLQEVMTKNHVVFLGILLSQPNDGKAIPDIFNQMKKTLNIFLEMQTKYGERDNVGQFEREFAKIILIADAGYFTVYNLYFIFINKINALIKPTSESREDNNNLRKKSGNSKKEIKSIRKYFTRVKGGYKCNQGRFLGFNKSIKIKHHKPHKDDNLPDICKDERQIYSRNSCRGCEYEEICPKKIEDRKSFLIRWMTDRFLDKRRNFNYNPRAAISEGINAFHKSDDGHLKFVGTTLNAVKTECDFRNAVYNLTRIETLKEEGL